MNDSYILDFLGGLQQKRSQKQVNADIKQLEKTINMLRLTATLAQGSSKKEINAYLKQLSSQLSTIKLKAQIDSKNLKSEVNKALNSVSFKDIDVLNIDDNKTKLKIQKVIADTKAFVEKNPISVGINIDSKRSKLDNDLTTYLNRNTKISESSVLLNEANKVRDLIGAITDKKSLREATDAFQLYKSSVASVGFNTKSTTDKIKDMFSHITKLGSIFSVTSLAVNNFTKSLGTLKDLDSILTEISKTSDLTAKELEKLGNTSFESASKYGKTASDYLTGIQEMSRSGFYGDKGAAMAEQSLLAQAAGGMTADIANKYILATNAAYKYNGEAEKLNAVLDGQNSITNRNSVALSDMAIAMSEAGTVASSYRVSIEDLSAMIGTMESVTKLGGSEVGNGIKAILINLQNATSDKIVDTLNAANASMTEFVNGTEKLRDPISILRDLAKTFNQLDEDDALRAEILTNIGGKYQASKLAALLQNIEMFDKMLIDYSEGSGSAMEEAMKSANNWSGKLNQLQNSWDSLVNSVINKNSVLNGLSFGDKLIQGAESFIDTFGTIPTILTAVNASLVTMRKDYGLTKIWDKENQKIDVEGNVFGIDISKIKNLKKHYDEAAIAIKRWNKELVSGKADLEVFDNVCVKNSASLKEYLSTCTKDAPASLSGYKDYLQSTGQATEDLRLKTILLNTALTFLGSIAVQAVITGIANAFDEFNETVVESKEKVDDINSKISDLKTQLEELNNLEYKSNFDEQKIAQLERELELQEKILEIEQKRLFQNQIGTKFSDYFDADSLISKQQAEYDHNNKENFANLSRGYEKYRSSLEDIDAELDALQEKLNSEDLSKHDKFITEGKIIELTEKRNNLLEKQRTIEDQLTVNMGEYLKNQQIAQDAIDSGLLTGSDLEKAESMAAYWNQMYQYSSEIVANIQKMNGTYDDTQDHILQSIRDISDDHGISDRNQYAELIEYTKDFTDEEEKLWLEATKGAKNATQAITMYEAELAKARQTVNGSGNLTFDQAWADSFTSENDKVRELGNTLLGLAEKGRLTKEIFNEADSTAGDYFKNLGISADEAILKINKLVDESSQLSSMASQISSISNALGTKQEEGFVSANTLSGFDVEVHGLESWDRFQEVLGSTASSYEECQEAANALATEWINSSNFLAQLTEENKEYYETQLQAMGVENYEEVISYANALNEAKEVLSQSSLMLGDATQDEIEALIAEGQYSELTANMILALYDAKIAEQAATIDTSADCEDLIALAGDTDRTSRSIELLIQLMDIYSGLESGAYDGNRLLREEALAEVDRIKKELEALANGETQELPIEPTVKLGAKGRSSAKAAGKSAGDAYKDGLKEALSDIESVISGVTKALDRQISSINTEKSAALDAIDEQKEAIENAKESALEAIETERNARLDAIEEQISSKQKTIDGINDEIKLMRDANSEREKQLALERAKFELERQQNQKTKLIYSSDKGLHYETDTTGIANAREQVRQIEFEIEITNKEKEIDLLEKEIDLLNEHKDQINEYYDDLIKKTEAFYDSQLKNLEKQRKETEIYYESLTKSIEDQKAKYQELTELLEKAELSAKLKQLGIDEEALLNGSAEEFEKLKAAYLDIVYQLNAGNDEVLLKLQELSGYEGTAPTMLEDSNGKLITMNEKLGTASQEVGNINSSLGETASTTSNVASNVDTLKTNLTDVNTLVTDEQTTFSTLLQTINDIIEAINQKTAAIQEEQNAVGIATSSEMADFLLLKEKILEVKETLDTISGAVDTLDATPIDNLTESFQYLYEKILLVSTTLGAGIEGQGEGVTNSIASAIQALNEISFEEGIITQFDNLRTAIDSVSSAISGGGESSGGEGQSSNSGSGKGGESGGKGSNGEGGGNSLTGAIESMGETANKVIGEPEAEGDSTVIGEFGSMKTAVNDVRDAIGTEGGKDGNSGGEEDDTLISSMEYLGDKTEEEMGGSGGDGIIARFEEFRDVIGEADEHVKGISDGLDEIDGETVECTIKVNIETSGGIPAYASGTALGAMNLDSAEYNAKYQGNAHVSGTANVTGNWGVRKPGKSLVGEIGQEIWVHAKNGTFETVGDNGPEWIKTEKDDLIFNHLQTKELLSKGNIVKTGKAYANGTVQYSDGTTIMPDGSTLRPLQPGDKGWDLLQKFQPLVDKILSGEEKIVSNAMFEGQRQFERWTNEITNNTAINNVTNNRNVQPVVNHINVTCPGVTSQQVAEQLGNVIGQELNKQFNGFSLYADQMSRKR